MKLNVNTNGNKKLVNNDKVRFMIWNITAVITCPFATEMCKRLCYALKAERLYPSVRASRERNLAMTMRDDFAINMIETIEHLLNSRAYQGKLALFRIHESGDFYSQEYFDKWLEVARHFEGDRRIKFGAYTKSVQYVHDLPSNFTVRFSIWDDTEPGEIEMAKAKGLPTYTADKLTAEDIENLGKSYCDCLNCGTCAKCYCQAVENIVCEIH